MGIIKKVAARCGHCLKFFFMPAHGLLWQIMMTISENYGFSRSAASRACVDNNGSPIPWYTYPALNLCLSVDFCIRICYNIYSINQRLHMQQKGLIMFETAKWICASMPEIASWRGRCITDEEEETLFATFPETTGSVVFAGNFDLPSDITRASLSICGLGYYDVYVNGELKADNTTELSLSRYKNAV